MAHNISIQEVFRSKWLGIRYISYDMNGKTTKNYEMVFRPNMEERNIEVQSVDIIPIIKYKDRPTEIIMIANFRPPVMKYVLEFPAGLMEDNDVQVNFSLFREMRSGSSKNRQGML